LSSSPSPSPKAFVRAVSGDAVASDSVVTMLRTSLQTAPLLSSLSVFVPSLSW
jgi:hypothetical protein